MLSNWKWIILGDSKSSNQAINYYNNNDRITN